ncbi:MAG: hypothetical protein K0B07_05635 [DPANN group archaeon]|nr:hypothetical protein [DPANN group archaeon]
MNKTSILRSNDFMNLKNREHYISDINPNEILQKITIGKTYHKWVYLMIQELEKKRIHYIRQYKR